MSLFLVRRLVSISLLFFCFFSLFYIYVVDDSIYSHARMVVTLLIVAMVLLVFKMDVEEVAELKGQYFKISNLILLGFCIVHFQFYIDLVMGYRGLQSRYVINPEVLNRSSAVSAMALCCFCIGYAFNLKVKVPPQRQLQHTGVTSLRGVKMVLLTIFIAVILFTPFSYFRSGYIDVELSNAAASSHKYFVLVAAGILMLNVRNLALSGVKVKGILEFVRYTGLFFSCLLFSFSALVAMSGDRGPIIGIFLAYIGSYIFITRKKFSILVVVLVILAASTSISVLGYVRHLEHVSSPMDAIAQALDKSSAAARKETLLSGTEELSRSVRTVHAAIDYTDVNGYFYGYYKIRSLIGMVPGLGRLLSPILEVDDRAVSPYLLTEHIGADHGMGTSVVADIWIDFGLLGVVIFFIFLGWFLRTVDVFSFSHMPLNIFWYVIIGALLITSIGISRGVFFDSIRDAVFSYVFVISGLWIYRFLPKIDK